MALLHSRIHHPKFFLSGVGLLGALTFGPSALAATDTGTFAVTASVDSVCAVSATPVNFGEYTGAQTDTTGTITVTCTNTTPYDVGLNAGGANGATVTTRGMNGPAGAGAPPLAYALYQDSGRGVNWGNTVGTDAVHSVGIGSAQSISVYARVAAGQFVQPGAYTDTITATVNY